MPSWVWAGGLTGSVGEEGCVYVCVLGGSGARTARLTLASTLLIDPLSAVSGVPSLFRETVYDSHLSRDVGLGHRLGVHGERTPMLNVNYSRGCGLSTNQQ